VQAIRELPKPLRLLGILNPLGVVEALGRAFMGRCGSIAAILAVLWGTAILIIRPSTWTPPVRSVLSRQLLFTAVDGVLSGVRFGAAVGVVVIVQAAIWIDTLGIAQGVIAPMMWRGIVRELAPLLACLVVIGRSCIPIATELATMMVNGEVELLDAEGVDPMTYLVVPRILSVVISVFCLAIIIATSMVATGYMLGWAVDAIRVDLWTFLEGIFRQANARDLIFFVPKTIIAGAFAGAICCIDGLNVRGTMTDIPRVASRTGIRALTAVLAISAILSVVFYGRFLMLKIV
jgi:phospholipid/cholesterol/gamma-HCH transport system permease protein